MAGSNTWRRYTADDGTNYSVLVAKHISETRLYGAQLSSTVGGGILFPARGSDNPELSSLIQMRYVIAHPYLATGQKRQYRKINVGNLSTWEQAYSTPFPFLEPQSGLLADRSQYWIIDSFHGEVRKTVQRIEEPNNSQQPQVSA